MKRYVTRSLVGPALLVALVALLGLIGLAAGCSSKHIDVNATSGTKDRFSPADDTDKPPESTTPREARRVARTPFVSLSTYDWDYQLWLSELRDRIAELQLPDDADVEVRILFYPQNEGRKPDITVICESSPEDKRRLEAQVTALPSLPPLPPDFPAGRLEAVLSRVPR